MLIPNRDSPNGYSAVMPAELQSVTFVTLSRPHKTLTTHKLACSCFAAIFGHQYRTYHVAPITNQTLAGTFTANEEVKLHNILLPEFHKTRRIQTLMARIFDHGCRYDMILGRNLMNDLGIVLDFNTKSMAWDGSTVTMREYDQTQEQTSLATNLLLDIIDSNLEANDSITLIDQPSDVHYQEKDVDPSGYKTKTIRTSLYEPSNLQDIVDKCVYLLPSQREQLYSLLNQFHNLFDRRLKTFKGPPAHLELIENLVPVHRRPYTIPTSQLAVLKEELRRLISIGVIEKAQCSESIAGTFIVPKKDGRVRWITDFRGLNKSLRRKVSLFARSAKSSNAAQVTNISQSWISPCNIIPLSWMSRPVTFVPSPHHLGFIASVACRWASANPPTSQWKRCIQFWMILKALNFIWTISEFSVPHGPLTYPFSQPFWDALNMWVLQLTH